eukprot:1886044-Rhodomonas_salina.1
MARAAARDQVAGSPGTVAGPGEGYGLRRNQMQKSAFSVHNLPVAFDSAVRPKLCGTEIAYGGSGSGVKHTGCPVLT